MCKNDLGESEFYMSPIYSNTVFHKNELNLLLASNFEIFQPETKRLGQATGKLFPSVSTGMLFDLLFIIPCGI